jgi:hypothetical protein
MFRNIILILKNPAIIGIIGYNTYKFTNCYYGYENIPERKIISGKEFKELTNGEVQLKILNKNMKHHDLQYVLGENVMIDRYSFNSVSCECGLHFSNKKGIRNWTSFGCKLHKVTVPDDAYVVCYDRDGKCKATKLIVEEQIDNIDDIKKSGITYIYDIIRFAKPGSFTINELLQYIKNKELKLYNIPDYYKTINFYKEGIFEEIIDPHMIPCELLSNDIIINTLIQLIKKTDDDNKYNKLSSMPSELLINSNFINEFEQYNSKTPIKVPNQLENLSGSDISYILGLQKSSYYEIYNLPISSKLYLLRRGILKVGYNDYGIDLIKYKLADKYLK